MAVWTVVNGELTWQNTIWPVQLPLMHCRLLPWIHTLMQGGKLFMLQSGGDLNGQAEIEAVCESVARVRPAFSKQFRTWGYVLIILALIDWIIVELWYALSVWIVDPALVCSNTVLICSWFALLWFMPFLLIMLSLFVADLQDSYWWHDEFLFTALVVKAAFVFFWLMLP